MKKKSVLKLLFFLGLAIIVVGVISWLVYPEWRSESRNFWPLLVAVVSGVLLIAGQVIKIILDVIAIGKQEYPAAPLQPTSAEKICQSLGKGGQITWIDRMALDPFDLQKHRRIVITGQMKQGKTREAAELIRRAVEDDLVPSARIFQPTSSFPFMSSTDLSQALKQGVDPHDPILVFFDDLPFHYYSDEALELLQEGLAALQVCTVVYVIATARTDQLTKKHRAWLKEQRFHIVQLKKLNKSQTRQLVEAAAKLFNLQLDEASLAAFLGHRDGRPETILISFRRLAAKGKTQVDGPLAEMVAKEGLVRAWEAVRSDISQRYPEASYLLQALAVFHQARVKARRYLVAAYAAHLWKGEGGSPFIVLRQRKLRTALSYLVNFDILERDGMIAYPDIIVESVSQEEQPEQVLGAFLRYHRRLFHHPQLRWLYLDARPHAWAFFDLAYQAQLRGEHRLARDYYSDAIRLRPEYRFYNNRGATYDDLADYPAALADYTRAIQLDPQDPAAYYNRGIAYRNLQKYPQAIVDYSRAIQLDPQDASAYYNRGNAYEHLENFPAALADYTSAIQLDEQDALAYYNRGLMYARLKEHDSALADYNQAIQLDPQMTAAYFNRAALYAELGDLPSALDDYARAAEIAPKEAKIYNNRGNLYRSLEDYPAALLEYTRSIELDPQEVTAWLNRGNTHTDLKDYPAALSDYAQALQINPNYAPAYTSRGNTYTDLQDYPAAIADYTRAIQLDHQDSIPVYNLACVYALQGMAAEACQWLEKALEMSPSYLEVVQADPDFNPVRQSAEYLALLGEYTSSHAGEAA